MANKKISMSDVAKISGLGKRFYDALYDRDVRVLGAIRKSLRKGLFTLGDGTEAVDFRYVTVVMDAAVKDARED